MSHLDCRIAGLHLYPVKSCGGVDLTEALLVETGLDLDRAYMLVDERGHMLTQRQCPRMALIGCKMLGTSEIELRAPGMLALDLHLERVEARTQATVWGDTVPAYDMGALAAQWCSDFLSRPARLVRFDPEHDRLSDPATTGADRARVEFADGYALLVASLDSMGEFNRRLSEAGQEAVSLQRFRPNLVLEGLQPFEEDHVRSLHIDTEQGPITLRLVKPCERCEVPQIDPLSAERNPAIGQVLAQFRANPKANGAITFGMNAIVTAGAGSVLKFGQTVRAVLDF